jgi:NitT/TauT family transport system substrate-binding protein
MSFVTVNRRQMLAAGAALPLSLIGASALRAADLTKIRISTAAAETGGAALYAKDVGFFTQAGLDADIQFGRSGAASVEAVVTGTSDFGGSAVSSIAQARSRGLPVIIVAAGGLMTGKVDGALVTLNDSPIQKAADLNGKTVAVTGLQSFQQYSTQYWIDKNGGDSSKVKWVEVGFADVNQAVESHRVDAASLFEPLITLALGTGKIKLLANTATAVGPRWLNSVWFSSDGYVQKNPDATRRFVNAVRQAANWANDHHEETNAILVKYLKLDPDLANRMTHDLQGTELTPALLQPSLDVMWRYNALPKSMTVDQLIWKPR